MRMFSVKSGSTGQFSQLNLTLVLEDGSKLLH